MNHLEDPLGRNGDEPINGIVDDFVGQNKNVKVSKPQNTYSLPLKKARCLIGDLINLITVEPRVHDSSIGSGGTGDKVVNSDIVSRGKIENA